MTKCNFNKRTGKPHSTLIKLKLAVSALKLPSTRRVFLHQDGKEISKRLKLPTTPKIQANKILPILEWETWAANIGDWFA